VAPVAAAGLAWAAAVRATNVLRGEDWAQNLAPRNLPGRSSASGGVPYWPPRLLVLR